MRNFPPIGSEQFVENSSTLNCLNKSNTDYVHEIRFFIICRCIHDSKDQSFSMNQQTSVDRVS